VFLWAGCPMRSEPEQGHGVTAIAASIASSLARSRDGSAAVDERRQADASAVDEANCACDSRRQDEGPAPRQVASQMSHDQPPGTKPTSDEYRVRADACLSWEREALTDEVRLACLTLANAWLKAAMSEDGGMSDSPLAPRL
jgi:hypothetical protein